MDSSRTPCVVYGDTATCTSHRDAVSQIAVEAGLAPVAWFSDSEGLRPHLSPADAPGLVTALDRCRQAACPLLVPFGIDVGGPAQLRLVGHWLNRHGLPLYVNRQIVPWDLPSDRVDLAVRTELDAAADLATAVSAAGVMPDLDALAGEFLGTTDEGLEALRQARTLARRDTAAGMEVPPEPDPSAPWETRRVQAVAYAAWLNLYTTQHTVAAALNALRVRTRGGRHWTQPTVSRMLREVA